jgi:hypothetical protein
MKKLYAGLCVVMSSLLIVSSFGKVDPTPEQQQTFDKEILPLLTEQCMDCHSVAKGKTKGGLSLDSHESLLKGGENGKVIDFHNVKESTFIKAINWDGDLRMPEKKKLSDQQIALLTKWIEQGAFDTRASGELKDKRDHWAFKLPQVPKVPTVKNESWCFNKIDYFILSKLEEKEIIPAPLASKETLLRRAYFDLIGLPPTPKEIEQFIQDESPKAYEKVIDRLLADKGYGERWGRHWLDTARYSDTTGITTFQRLDDYRLPYAWTYRNWVFDAINADMPYDMFLKNQLAADRIPDNNVSNLAALGFLTVGQRFNNANDTINDRIDVVGRGMLGLTLACIRCHDHKFDPLTIADYYALKGVFLSCTEPTEGPVINKKEGFQEFQAKLNELEQKSIDAYYKIQREEADFFGKNASPITEYIILMGKDTNADRKKLAGEIQTKHKWDARIARHIESAVGRHFNPNDKILGPFFKLVHVKENRDDVLSKMLQDTKTYSPIVLNFLKQQPQPLTDDIHTVAELVGKLFAEVEPQRANLFAQITNASFDPDDKDAYNISVFPSALNLAKNMNFETMRVEAKKWSIEMQDKLRASNTIQQINEFKLTATNGLVRAMAVEDAVKPTNSPLFPRGNPPAAGQATIVQRRFLEILNPEKTPFSDKESGRLELAEAIATKDNPLTARVLVNRVWMYHFGEGLVKTPDDLGNSAGTPTHPELLDFLATWFMADYGPQKPAWSVKALHKAIMLSKVYQQSSNTFSVETLKEYSKIDPGNNLLWRANVRRLDFEAYRDSLLSMGRVLQREPYGGPSFNVSEEPIIFRRTAYAYIDRSDMPDVLMQFDMSNPDQPNTRRASTVVPQQALFLMNSPLVAEVVQKISQRAELVEAVAKEKNTDKGITAVFKIVLQRYPTAKERKMALDFLVKENKEQANVKTGAETITAQAKKLAEAKFKQLQNNKDPKRAIVNQGELVERVAFSPWETLIQALIFSNEAAYVN